MRIERMIWGSYHVTDEFALPNLRIMESAADRIFDDEGVDVTGWPVEITDNAGYWTVIFLPPVTDDDYLEFEDLT